MIQIEKKEIKSCCGKKQSIWKLNKSLNRDHIKIFSDNGFVYNKNYYNSGILYIENNTIIITGVLGLNELKIVNKSKNNNDNIQELERLILLNF